ncbi:MAG: hypothetical protein ACR65R_17080 [Methylomicrobium sp.]
MAFVNEKISDKDKARISSVITFEKVRALARWIPRIQEPYWWTVDHERGVYLLCLNGKGREQLAYYAVGINDEFVVFNLDEKGIGDEASGLKYQWTVYDLKIPKSLESSQEKIKQFIREGLEEYAYFRPFAKGGTPNEPNTIARKNIHFFSVEFK